MAIILTSAARSSTRIIVTNHAQYFRRCDKIAVIDTKLHHRSLPFVSTYDARNVEKGAATIVAFGTFSHGR
jgi:NAD(P)H-hydrate repair Nnr-like enzyme with NAD(P)H-hydrate dehydratase domain